MKTSERHRIKRNELATFLEYAVFTVEENLKPIAIGVAAVLVLAVGTYGWTRWSGSREAEAAYRFGAILRIRDTPIALSPEAINAPAGTQVFATIEEREGRVIDLADGILEEYGSSASAPRAMYYKALALSNLGRYDEVATSLETLLHDYPDDFVAPHARFKLGTVLQIQGRPGEALIHFQMLAEDVRSLFPREEGLLGVARCHEQLGQKNEAVRTYQRVLTEFPGSEYFAEARRRIDELS